MRFHVALLFIFLTGFATFRPALAYAKSGLVGAEWTFTNEHLIALAQSDYSGHADAIQETRKLWIDLIRKKCTNCSIEGNRVTVNDQFWFQLDMDPFVIEITTQPFHVDEISEELKIEIQDLIWNSARQIGLKPHQRIGGGHIHFDLMSHFEGDRLLFRNFIVDLANHPELFLGALSFDLQNAPPLAVLPAEQRSEFEKLLAEFDSSEMTIESFSREMNKRVYKHTFIETESSPKNKPFKYQVVNLSHRSTIEVRGNRPQTSFVHFLLIAELFEARMKYLKTFNKPIIYINRDLTNSVSVETVDHIDRLSTTLTAEQIAGSFKNFVETTGLEWRTYARYLPTQTKLQLRPSRAVKACSQLFKLQ